jgi:ATP-dependent protease Clp ATPase subunit
MGKLRCSFCHKKDTEVSKLVAGPRVLICDECVAVASRLMEAPPDARPPFEHRSLRQRVAERFARLLGAGHRRGMRSVAEPG